MAVVSYIQLIKFVDDFASQHEQIQRFKAEFSEQLPNFATENEAYPILFMAPIDSQFLSNEDNFGVRFYCFDIIQKDRANINTILSDTNLILNDLQKWFKEGDNYTFDILNNPVAIPINNALLDYVAGWQMDVTFNVDTYCVSEIPFADSPLIPIEGYDIIYSRFLTCETVTGCTSFQEYIENALSNFTATTGTEIFVTGGTYNQSTGIASFTNTTGGTFNVSGFNTGYTLTSSGITTALGYVPLSAYTDTFVSGGTYDSGTGVATFTNTTGGTFNVSGFNTGGGSADSYWISGSTGSYSLKTINDSGLDATGDYALAEGQATIANGVASHAEGYLTTADGDYSHVEGVSSIASGQTSHAEGNNTRAYGDYSHAEGNTSIAQGETSHAEGEGTTAIGFYSHSEGRATTAFGTSSHVEGEATTANGDSSHAEGESTIAESNYSHAEGLNSTAQGEASHAEGGGTRTLANYAHSEGYQTLAFGIASHAEGWNTRANGNYSHSEGDFTTADNIGSHAGGYNSVASGLYSFVHGSGSTASGTNTVVFGSNITGTSANTVYVPNIQFDLNAPSTMDVGRMEWNDSDGTVDLRLKGNNVTLQIGQEQVVRVVNKTGANLLESQYRAVRVRNVSEGGAQGQRLAVVLAQANTDINSLDTIGIVTENINDNQEGFITLLGQVRNINTTGSLQGETWVDGDVLYLSPSSAGGLTKVKPIAPNKQIVIGYVEYAHVNNGKIYVNIQNGYDIQDLNNVSITGTPNNGNLLSYSSSLSAWTNTAVSSITPTQAFRLLGTAITVAGSSGNRFFPIALFINNATELVTQYYVEQAMTLKQLTIRTTSTQPSTGSFTAVVRKNGVDTALLITIPANAVANIFTVAVDVSLAVGDLINYRVNNLATTANANITQMSLLYI